MKLQDFIADTTEREVAYLFQTARYVPADKLEWKPLGNGRSCLDQLQECAQAPNWFIPLLEHRTAPDYDQDEWARTRKQWDTIDKCEEACRENTARLTRIIRNFPDSQLDDEIPHPFVPGVTIKMADVMLFHYWNLVYHVGQINYIQTLLGDFEMR